MEIYNDIVSKTKPAKQRANTKRPSNMSHTCV